MLEIGRVVLRARQQPAQGALREELGFVDLVLGVAVGLELDDEAQDEPSPILARPVNQIPASDCCAKRLRSRSTALVVPEAPRCATRTPGWLRAHPAACSM